MAFIETFPVNQATGEVRAMYERAQANLGYVPNYAKVFSLRPEVMGAWSGLLASIWGHMDLRTRHAGGGPHGFDGWPPVLVMRVAR